MCGSYVLSPTSLALLSARPFHSTDLQLTSFYIQIFLLLVFKGILIFSAVHRKFQLPLILVSEIKLCTNALASLLGLVTASIYVSKGTTWTCMSMFPTDHFDLQVQVLVAILTDLLASICFYLSFNSRYN